MKTFFNLFSESFVSAFGWMLVHSLWQGALFAAIAGIGLFLLRKSSAGFRYNTGVLALSAQVISSVITFCYYYFYTPSRIITSSLKSTAYEATDWKVRTYDVSLTSKIHIWLSTHIQEFVIFWLIGALILTLRFLGSWLYTEHLRHSAKLVINKEWRTRFGILTAKLKINQSIDLKESARILTPMVIGTLSPVVLIPIGLLTGLPSSQIEAILAHELAHIRRHDYLVNMLQSLVEVVFFFHPALWWLSERVRVEREHCCDDMAIEVCGDRMALAHALVGIAEWNTSHSLAMAFASKKPLLLHRVKRVLGIAPKTTKILGTLPMIIVFAAALIGISVYAAEQDQDTLRKKKVKTHQAADRRKKVISIEKDNNIVSIRSEEPEMIVGILDTVDDNISEAVDNDFYVSENSFMSDSLRNSLSKFHQKMAALQKEMEPLQHRMQELHLEMEKQHFDVEQFSRGMEKLEWKKQRANDARQSLIDKRSALLYPDNKSKIKLNEADLEKQLGDFEQQIKAQEQIITQLNSDLASSRKESEKAGEPYKKVEKEIDELHNQMEEIGHRMELESREMGRLVPPPPPGKVLSIRGKRPTGFRRTTMSIPAAPAPKAPPASPKAPVPPLPPLKE